MIYLISFCVFEIHKIFELVFSENSACSNIYPFSPSELKLLSGVENTLSIVCFSVRQHKKGRTQKDKNIGSKEEKEYNKTA